jgi:hypothetical protein
VFETFRETSGAAVDFVNIHSSRRFRTRALLGKRKQRGKELQRAPRCAY